MHHAPVGQTKEEIFLTSARSAVALLTVMVVLSAEPRDEERLSAVTLATDASKLSMEAALTSVPSAAVADVEMVIVNEREFSD